MNVDEESYRIKPILKLVINSIWNIIGKWERNFNKKTKEELETLKNEIASLNEKAKAGEKENIK